MNAEPAPPAADGHRTPAVCPVAHPAPHYRISRERDVRAVLTDDTTWPSRLGPGLVHAQPGGVLVASDPPLHTRQRALLAPAFRPTAVAGLGGSVQELVDDLVDGLAPRGHADLMADLAVPLSMTVTCRMLGAEVEHAPRYWSWVLALAEGLSRPRGSLDHRVAPAYRSFHLHFDAHLRRRRAHLDGGGTPPPDLLTTLMTAEPDGRPLRHAELLGFCQFLLVAGSSTTALLIGNVVHRLLTSPDQLDLVRRDPGLVAAAVEESLRVDAPLRGLFRTAGRATDLAGVAIPERAKVLPLLAAANRDPDHWPDPDRFDITRPPAQLRRHLAFGHGVHYCLGASLARLEATTAVRAVLEGLPGLRPDGVPDRVRAELLNGFERLPVAWRV
ncbi:cytochrome P450 [Micromonospora sp. WMMD998]|uniref:cytochrome P450 n=1 Tax=Micromonospora sp. WMMD998 TaxID=3016092 RepID=UPI00249CD05C|nr:cytochrome P450 [Micromonospora sp. WMMD998]WFE41001.1 cytochrome P450 [Micromonospora sp. WMMD998]